MLNRGLATNGVDACAGCVWAACPAAAPAPTETTAEARVNHNTVDVLGIRTVERQENGITGLNIVDGNSLSAIHDRGAAGDVVGICSARTTVLDRNTRATDSGDCANGPVTALEPSSTRVLASVLSTCTCGLCSRCRGRLAFLVLHASQETSTKQYQRGYRKDGGRGQTGSLMLWFWPVGEFAEANLCHITTLCRDNMQND